MYAELEDMFNRNGSAYIRYKFTIPDQETIDAIEELNLRIRYDDGFVAYLNGHEIERQNVNSTNWNSIASSSHTNRLTRHPYHQRQAVQAVFVRLPTTYDDTVRIR